MRSPCEKIFPRYEAVIQMLMDGAFAELNLSLQYVCNIRDDGLKQGGGIALIPFIPTKLAPWINFVENDVILKEGAPQEVKGMYEKLREDLKKGQKSMLISEQ